MKNLIKKVFAQKPGSPKGGWYYVLQCIFCQKPYIAPGYEINAGKMLKYCSNSCQTLDPKRAEAARLANTFVDKSGSNNANFKDGASIYRQFIKESCEICGRKTEELMKIGNNRKRNPLLVHHCDMDRRNSSPDNLRTLCYSCHMRVHNPSNYGKYPDFQKW